MARNHHSLKALAGTVALLALLGGCVLPAPYRAPSPPPVGVPPPSSVPPAPPPAAAEAPAPAPIVREYRLGAAARSLVTQARDEVTRGDLPAASMTLDRALRIEPSNPLLWIEAGRLRLQANDARQAEGFSRKALSLATGDRSAQSQAGHVLADALRAQRRNQEAREVETQPWMN